MATRAYGRWTLPNPPPHPLLLSRPHPPPHFLFLQLAESSATSELRRKPSSAGSFLPSGLNSNLQRRLHWLLGGLPPPGTLASAFPSWPLSQSALPCSFSECLSNWKVGSMKAGTESILPTVYPIPQLPGWGWPMTTVLWKLLNQRITHNRDKPSWEA